MGGHLHKPNILQSTLVILTKFCEQWSYSLIGVTNPLQLINSSVQRCPNYSRSYHYCNIYIFLRIFCFLFFVFLVFVFGIQHRHKNVSIVKYHWSMFAWILLLSPAYMLYISQHYSKLPSFMFVLCNPSSFKKHLVLLSVLCFYDKQILSFGETLIKRFINCWD